MANIIKQVIPDIKGQLIATTHNTYIMDSLSTDNIYVIRIDSKGYKELGCISSIEKNKTKSNTRQKYYEGNFSGIPYVANINLKDLIDEDYK